MRWVDTNAQRERWLHSSRPRSTISVCCGAMVVNSIEFVLLTCLFLIWITLLSCEGISANDPTVPTECRWCFT